MRKIQTYILLMIFTTGYIFMNQSCDVIEEPFVDLTNSDTITSGNGGDTTVDVRKILLEDITGHKCPNCPEAALEAKSLKAKYGDQLVVMTVHAGFYSTPNATGHFTYDFRTTEGGEIHDYYNVKFFPAGLINRTTPDGAPSPVLTKGAWDAAVGALVDLPQQASIIIDNSYSEGTRKLDSHIEIEFLENMQGTFNVVAYIVENGIVKPQESEAGVIEDYDHEHVLRASLNGTWGQPVGGDGNAVTDEVSTHDLSITLDKEWVAEKCDLIVVVHQFDSPTRAIVQAEQEHVIK